MSDRGANGRFAAGNAGGPGRPRRQVEEEYRNITLGKVSQRRWAKIVARAVDDAEAGDHHARTWLVKLLGLEPPARVAATDGDGNTPTLSTFLALTAAKHEAGVEPSNIIDPDLAYQAAAAAQPAAGTSDNAANLPSDATAIVVAPDGGLTYSAAGEEQAGE